MYGMTPEQFWKGLPELFWAYRTSFYKNQEFEMQKQNTLLWLSGAYYLRAMAEVETGGKSKYPREPFQLQDKEKVKQKEKNSIELREENERNIKFMVANSQLALMKKNKQK